MLLATDPDTGGLIEATPDGRRRAVTPCCGVEAIAKTGDVMSWHWAHKATRDCDTWSEPESEWHLAWKRRARELGARVEVPFSAGGSIVHRADVVTPDGRIIELQHSPISTREAVEREFFYSAHGGIAWLFDAEAFGWLEDVRERDTLGRLHALGGTVPPAVLAMYRNDLSALRGRMGRVKLWDALRAPLLLDWGNGEELVHVVDRRFVRYVGETWFRWRDVWFADLLSSRRLALYRTSRGAPPAVPIAAPVRACAVCGEELAQWWAGVWVCPVALKGGHTWRQGSQLARGQEGAA